MIKNHKVAEICENVLAKERDGGEVFPEDGGEEKTNQKVHTEDQTVQRIVKSKFYFYHFLENTYRSSIELLSNSWVC